MTEFVQKFGALDEDVPLGAGCDPTQAISQPTRESSVVVLPRHEFDIVEDAHGNVISAVRKGTTP